MDKLSFLGIFVAMATILGSQVAEGVHLDSLMNLPAFLIVLGGSLGAVILETPKSTLVRAFKMFFWIVRPPKFDISKLQNDIINWNSVLKKEGILGLEKVMEETTEPFNKRALQLCVDGHDVNDIQHLLEIEADNEHDRCINSARIFEALGGYSPTMGILGAVLGLTHVLRQLNEPAQLGAGIAVAFVATIYGVAFANLFWLPVASKLKQRSDERLYLRRIVLMGVVSMAEGNGTRALQNKLQSFGGKLLG